MQTGQIKQSVLNLQRMSFEEIKYSRDLNAPPETEYEMNFNRNISTYEDPTHFRVALTANIWSKNEKTTKLSVTLVGFFTCDCEDDAIKTNLVNNNTIAILFPYLRSQISLITTQPDIPPITLPPMNIVGMFQEAEKQNN